jgi:hypothetical protein
MLRLGHSELRLRGLEAQNQVFRSSVIGGSDAQIWDTQTQMLKPRCLELRLRGSNSESQTLRIRHSDAQNWRYRCSDLDTQTQILRLRCLELSLRCLVTQISDAQMLGHSDLRCSDAWSLRSQMLRCLHSDTWSLGCSDTQSLGLDSEPQMLRCSDSDTWNFGSSDLRKLVIDHMM